MFGTVSKATYGYVWCSVCQKITARTRETEPLPFCRPCENWTEPVLCDHRDCEAEATVQVYESDTDAAQYFCEEHA